MLLSLYCNVTYPLIYMYFPLLCRNYTTPKREKYTNKEEEEYYVTYPA